MACSVAAWWVGGPQAQGLHCRWTLEKGSGHGKGPSDHALSLEPFHCSVVVLSGLLVGPRG